MDTNEISQREQQRRDRQRATSIDQFCTRYGIGRTTIYKEIKAGRLRARKCGKRTIIADEDGEDWLRGLPIVNPGTAHQESAS